MPNCEPFSHSPFGAYAATTMLLRASSMRICLSLPLGAPPSDQLAAVDQDDHAFVRARAWRRHLDRVYRGQPDGAIGVRRVLPVRVRKTAYCRALIRDFLAAALASRASTAVPCRVRFGRGAKACLSCRSTRPGAISRIAGRGVAPGFSAQFVHKRRRLLRKPLLRE